MLSKEVLSEPLVGAAPDNDWGYGNLISVLARQRLWLFGVTGGVLLVSFVLTLLAKPTYLSSLQVLVEPNYTAQTPNNQEDNLGVDPQVRVDISTQLEVLQSSELLQKAVDPLLSEYPDLDTAEIQARLQISPIYQSDANNRKIRTNLLQINYFDIDPNKTQTVLNTLLSVYRNYNLEQQKLRLSKGLAFINEQLPLVRQNVAETEMALQRFRNSSGTIDPIEQSRRATETLQELQQERERVRASLQEAIASYTNLQNQLQLSPRGAMASARLSQSSLYQSRLAEIQKLDIEISQQQQTLAPGHPRIQELLQLRQEQEQALQAESARVLGGESLPSDNAGLISSGQLGSNDLAQVRQLNDAQNLVLSLQAKDSSLAQTENRLKQEVARFPSLIARYEQLKPELELRRSTLQKLLDAKQELSLEIARGGFNWEVVEAPALGEKVGPSLIRNLFLGGIVGLFLGGAAAFIRDALDDSVQDSDRLERELNLPLLGIVPELPHADNNGLSSLALTPNFAARSEQMTSLLQWRPIRESLDLIYTNIRLSMGERPLKSILITSALAGEGKTSMTMGLAISAARLDHRVLIIDADLRRPQLHEVFGLGNSKGFSTLLTERPSIQEVLDMPQWVYMKWEEMPEPETAQTALAPRSFMPPTDLSIDVLTAGPMSPDPVKLLNSDYIRDIVHAYQDSYDLILVDAPPVLGMVDTLQIGAACDGVVFVSRIGQVTYSELQESADMLKRLNCVGIVANGSKTSSKLAARGYAYSR